VHCPARVASGKSHHRPGIRPPGRKARMQSRSDDVSRALYASKIIAYAQGFNQIPGPQRRIQLGAFRWATMADDLAVWRRAHQVPIITGSSLLRPTTMTPTCPRDRRSLRFP